MHTLLVEDDDSLGAALQQLLSRDGHDVRWLRTITEARAALTEASHRLLLLDVMLPDGNGMDLLRWLRGRDARLPVILMTVRATVDERADGLDQGADDYLPKPFAVDELRARIRALLRRADGAGRRGLRIGPLEIDPLRRTVRTGERSVLLSPRETELLLALAADPGSVLTRRQLAAALPSGASADGNAVDVHIHNLRTKIGHDRIVTVRGVGYSLRRDD